MRIILVGYGKMGKAVEAESLRRNHEIVGIVEKNDVSKLHINYTNNADVLIDFTHPDSIMENIRNYAALGLPIVCGTTGWHESADEVKSLATAHNIGFIYSSNFSIGVNILFKLNKELAKWMNPYPEYDCFIEEQHHRHKADAPSGTALSLANDILTNLDRKNCMVTDALQNRSPKEEELSVGYIRGGEIIGKHKVSYSSDIDTISIEHFAHNRRGFALGAVIAAEWIQDKQGFFNFAEIF